MIKKNLILTELPERYPKIEGIDIEAIYRPVNRFLRFIRYLHHKSGILPQYKSLWIGNWKRELKSYNQIIIFDSIFDYTPLNILQNRFHNQINFCYRNRVKSNITHSCISRDPKVLQEKYKCRIWSYSKEDCQSYNLLYYNQFHLIPSNLSSSHNSEIDAIFIGLDKGRLASLKELKSTLNERGFNCILKIVPSKKTHYKTSDREYLCKPYSYLELLKIEAKAKCIVDWVGGTNKGITFRCLEAQVLQKKLITNSTEIINFDFYSPSNIYIWGHDSLDRLSEFLNSEFDNSILKDLNKYSFISFCNMVFNT